MKIFKYLKPYWFLTLMAPLTMLGEVVMDLLQPQLMSQIINIGLGGNNTEFILKTGLLMLLLVVIGGICGFASAGFASAASQNFADDLRQECFKKVMSLSFEQTDDFTTGSLVTRITNDITMIQNMVASSLRMFVRTIFLFTGGLIMMLRIEPSFGIVLAVIIPIEFACVIFFINKMPKHFMKVQEKLDDVNAVVQENVTGSRVVKAYSKEEFESDRFNTANFNLTEISLKVQKMMSLLTPVLMIFMNIVVICIIYVGAIEVRIPNSKLLVGDVMAAISYVSQILMGVMQIGFMFLTVTRARASIIRINQILDTDIAVKSGNIEETNIQGEVEFKNVYFAYPTTSKTVINDFSIKVNNGSTLAILGSTGSGKTSVINLVPRFYDVTSGEVLVDGINVKEYSLKLLRSNISFVSQKTELFKGTIEENIKWGNPNASFEEVELAAKAAQAHNFITEFTDGYNTIIGEKGSSLSGGQKQRIAIARALIRRPKILILDDATSALDLKTEAMLYQALRENYGDTTIILVAQRVASVTGAEKIIVLDNGSIAAEGTNDELLETSSIYQDIYNSQLKREGGNK